MIREYEEGTKSEVTLFVGKEIEKTTFYREDTLFVVGVQDTEELLKIANEEKCSHIYLGANHSFKNEFQNEVLEQVQILINNGLRVTLDISLFVWNEINDKLAILGKNEKFAINLSVPVPNVDMIYNMNIKIDDIGFNQTNSGVYIYQPHHKDKTYWCEYSKDKVIK